MHRRRVLIGCPVSQSPQILRLFLRSLARLRLEAFEASYHFIDDNREALSSAQLREFARQHPRVTVALPDAPAEAYRGHRWSQELIWRVAAFKDGMLERARREAFDCALLLDSDLLLHPDTVNRLAAARKPIISEVFWTRWTEEAVEQPQVWLSDFYTQYEALPGETLTPEEERARTFAFFDRLRAPGVYEVGGLGACTLIDRAALLAGVSFRRIKNLSFWGEDRHFCVRASALGIDLFVDTHCPAYHVFRDAQIPGGAEFLNRQD